MEVEQKEVYKELLNDHPELHPDILLPSLKNITVPDCILMNNNTDTNVDTNVLRRTLSTNKKRKFVYDDLSSEYEPLCNTVNNESNWLTRGLSLANQAPWLFVQLQVKPNSNFDVADVAHDVLEDPHLDKVFKWRQRSQYEKPRAPFILQVQDQVNQTCITLSHAISIIQQLRYFYTTQHMPRCVVDWHLMPEVQQQVQGYVDHISKRSVMKTVVLCMQRQNWHGLPSVIPILPSEMCEHIYKYMEDDDVHLYKDITIFGTENTFEYF